MDREAFKQHLNSRFEVETEGVPAVSLELIEVTAALSDGRFEQFSIFFRGPLAALLPQQTYKVRHDQMSTFDLFIVPIGAFADGVHYQAVFSRLLRDSH
jgi:hypothetical protein